MCEFQVFVGEKFPENCHAAQAVCQISSFSGVSIVQDEMTSSDRTLDSINAALREHLKVPSFILTITSTLTLEGYVALKNKCR